MTTWAAVGWLTFFVLLVALLRTRRRRRRTVPLGGHPVDFYSAYRLPGRKRSGKGF